ncbi:MAG: helix-turn-helix transcriptional regulator [Burkholderiales bacterium]|nr:helix-turn-helix transcriptional regulator [Burkholderiales bacterium]
MSKLPVLAKRLKEARLRAGISQMALGVAAGIDEFSASPRINQYEKGKHTPDFLTANNLAAALGVPTPYLYSQDDKVAELLLFFDKLPKKKKDVVLAYLKQIAGDS